MKVVRIRYAHSEPIFWKVGFEVLEAGNLEAAKLLADGAAELGFVPITMAAELGFPVVPRLAIYSVGPIISARLFRGDGDSAYCAVSDTTVSALVLRRLLGLEFVRVEDPWEALRRCRGVLVVGDEALRMADRGIPYLVDVGELWHARIGSPLFFAVLVARRWSAEAERALAEMERSVASFYEDPRPVIESVAKRLGVSKSLLEEYYSRSRYIVGQDGVRHMEREAEILGLPALKFLSSPR